MKIQNFSVYKWYNKYHLNFNTEYTEYMEEKFNTKEELKKYLDMYFFKEV